MRSGDGSDRGETVLLGLGSNLGDRLEHLRMGVRILRDRIRVTAVSSVVESEAQGVAAGPDSPDFLNAVVRGRTELGPEELLKVCRCIEEAAGRARTRPGAPRTLDIDLLFHGDRIVRQEGLTIPHPRWKERGFVLAPLEQVAADWRDPESGRTVTEICRDREELTERVRMAAPGTALEEA